MHGINLKMHIKSTVYRNKKQLKLMDLNVIKYEVKEKKLFQVQEYLVMLN